MIDRVQFSTGPAVGADGAATATGYSVHVAGKVLAVDYRLLDSPPNTTDLVVSDENDPNGENFVSLGNIAAAGGKYCPRRPIQTNQYADVTYDGTRKVYDYYVVCGRLKATISQANAGDSITLTIWLEV
jgi:hypothetical protein